MTCASLGPQSLTIWSAEGSWPAVLWALKAMGHAVGLGLLELMKLSCYAGVPAQYLSASLLHFLWSWGDVSCEVKPVSC